MPLTLLNLVTKSRKFFSTSLVEIDDVFDFFQPKDFFLQYKLFESVCFYLFWSQNMLEDFFERSTFTKRFLRFRKAFWEAIALLSLPLTRPHPCVTAIPILINFINTLFSSRIIFFILGHQVFALSQQLSSQAESDCIFPKTEFAEHLVLLRNT